MRSFLDPPSTDRECVACVLGGVAGAVFAYFGVELLERSARHFRAAMSVRPSVCRASTRSASTRQRFFTLAASIVVDPLIALRE